MLRAAYLILLIVVVGAFAIVIGQDLPPVACPQYFQYHRSNSDGSYVGKITIPNVNWGETVLKVEFSQLSYEGKAATLILDENKGSAHFKIKNNLPINYLVEFPKSSVLPKLTGLFVNGRLICSSPEYPGNSITTRMQNTMRTSVETYYTKVPLPGGAESPTTPQTFIQRQGPEQPSPSVCGQEGAALPFILGGTSLARGQFPWLAAIFQKAVGISKFICSGSLISSRTILTAGHCIRLAQLEPTNMAVQLGRYDLFVSNEKDVLEVNIQTVHMNPDYNDAKISDADVALLLMATTVAFTDLIRPICLWSESDDVNLVVSLTGLVTGWGGDEHGNTLSPLPKMAPAKIVSESQCLRSSERFNQITSSRTFCAGQQDGVGPCMGDSGGGLMLKRNGRWTLRGIISVGQTRLKDDKKQCDLSQYVVYCDVAKHRNWVQNNMLL